VKDSGVGVSPETKAKLFEKFSRGEGGKLNTGGSGLGLYLAREIARAHKGDVVIDSEGLGKGSTFSVTLPAVGGRVK
jgi:signal transduction histidine kinase